MYKDTSKPRDTFCASRGGKMTAKCKGAVHENNKPPEPRKRQRMGSYFILFMQFIVASVIKCGEDRKHRVVEDALPVFVRKTKRRETTIPMTETSD
jgi:hypothetical protein